MGLFLFVLGHQWQNKLLDTMGTFSILIIKFPKFTKYSQLWVHHQTSPNTISDLTINSVLSVIWLYLTQFSSIFSHWGPKLLPHPRATCSGGQIISLPPSTSSGPLKIGHSEDSFMPCLRRPTPPSPALLGCHVWLHLV
jgi:hypothetical protein